MAVHTRGDKTPHLVKHIGYGKEDGGEQGQLEGREKG